MLKDFEIIPHTADLQIRVYGKNEEELFKNALIGMFQSIKPTVENCEIKNNRVVCDKLPIRREVEIESDDLENLLIEFLSECLYLSDVNNEAYFDVKIHDLTDTKLYATIYGTEIQGFESVEIKAVTYHNFEIVHKNNYLTCDIVFDI